VRLAAARPSGITVPHAGRRHDSLSSSRVAKVCRSVSLSGARMNQLMVYLPGKAFPKPSIALEMHVVLRRHQINDISRPRLQARIGEMCPCRHSAQEVQPAEYYVIRPEELQRGRLAINEQVALIFLLSRVPSRPRPNNASPSRTADQPVRARLCHGLLLEGCSSEWAISPWTYHRLSGRTALSCYSMDVSFTIII